MPQLLILLIPFLFYHNTTIAGPDSAVYLAVARSIVAHGTLNTLPETLTEEGPYQITKTHHDPIHQNIGGVLFILPATALSVASHYGAQHIANLPQRLYDLEYHEGVWLGCVTYLLAILSCLLMHRVACCYHGRSVVITALLLCAYGGPLLVYTVIYPCQTNLPVAFVSSLLLYVYHFADRNKNLTWLLIGAIWGLGTFVRFEFAVWGVLILYGLMQSKASCGVWSTVLLRAFIAGCGGLLFIIPSVLIRYILFGHAGSTYEVLFDTAILSKSYLMLVGTRNGLFAFWPILGVALLGYFAKFSKNPPVYHVLFIILVLEFIVCGSKLFWMGEMGDSFGQRNFLVVFPCFIFYLARLLEGAKKYFYWLVSACVLCVVWAIVVYAAYGLKWHLPNAVIGFLMPYQIDRMFAVLTTYYPLFLEESVSLLLVPKHLDVVWLLPLFSLAVLSVWLLVRRLDQKQLCTCCLVVIVLIAGTTTVFLVGAGSRGERRFLEISANNRQATFITRNYEIDYEIIGSTIDIVAFFMELSDNRHAHYYKDKTLRFLRQEAPDQVSNFEQACEALLLRQSLGWPRLVPEQSQHDLLVWYQTALLDMQKNRVPRDLREQILY